MPSLVNFQTTYQIELTTEEIKAQAAEIQKCKAAIERYYGGHKYVKQCQVTTRELSGALSLLVNVYFDASVDSFQSMKDSEDKIHFIEMVAAHLNECQFE